MKPVWLIQTNIDDIDTKPIIEEVAAQGMRVLEIETKLGRDIDFEMFGDGDCGVCYGSIDFVRQAKRLSSYVPGPWCNFYNMKCSTYYAYLGEHLLNSDYIMMPLGDVIRSWEKLTDLASGRSLFVRPDTGDKQFTGHTIKPENKHEIQALIEMVGEETLVVIDTEKKITAEWRFVICDRKVVAGCRYLPDESQKGYRPPPPSFRLAGLVALKEWQPDRCYTIDIAESEGQIHLLEINSFSCAGFYNCNIESIVREASIAAQKEWEDYNVW